MEANDTILSHGDFGLPIIQGHDALLARSRLASLLLGDVAQELELPPVEDLTIAMTALARGSRHKALLPLGTCPEELTLLRRGDDVLVSHYSTGGAMEVALLDRPVALRAALEGCANAMLRRARYETDPVARQVAVRVAERALVSELLADPSARTTAVSRRGGLLDAPEDGRPLGFGFHVRLRPGPNVSGDSVVRADAHALLFHGELWAFARGRRVPLVRGPVMLAVQSMLAASRALTQAWEQRRRLHLRLSAGAFRFGVHMDDEQRVELVLDACAEDPIRITDLSLEQAALPVLRLASDLLRALVSVDRGQSRNLRVRELREEVRSLRRVIRLHGRHDSFVNRDPDRLRLGSPPKGSDSAQRTERASETPSALPAAANLRFGERWSIAVDGLDAASTFLCGDRLVLAGADHTLALDRDSGDVLWAHPARGGMSLMAGRTLAHITPEGDLELCEVSDGECYASTRLKPRMNGPATCFAVNGPGIPPAIILAEGSHHLVSVDVRTGRPTWSFSVPGAGSFELRRAGRVLIVTCGDSAVHALDVVTGEPVWRVRDRGRFTHAVAISGDRVVALRGEPGGRLGAVLGIDLFSGEVEWEVELDSAPVAAPLISGKTLLVPLAGTSSEAEPGIQLELSAHDLVTGKRLYRAADPGIGAGAAAMTLDGSLLVNSPTGRFSSMDVETGALRYVHQLVDPVAEDVPRRLEPVLRGGALFVPAAEVRVLRPSDGADLARLPIDLVPDWLRVDERGWVYT
ncbi:MAG: PQQ-binding-like beta-propeller repeat protein, partial [Deltaproteobacteria bacterium]|nr:PQQ-binding-like beta-propeller repeat protein [Deltaproteobacteria bacterium]